MQLFNNADYTDNDNVNSLNYAETAESGDKASTVCANSVTQIYQ